MREYFLQFNEYNLWANNNTGESIRNTTEMSPKAADIFSHIIIAQAIWLNRIRKQQRSFESPWIKLTSEQCLEYSQNFYGEMKIYLGNISAEEFSKQIEYKNVNGDSFKNNLSDIIAHVFNHSSYHRGHIAQLVKKSNGKPAVTDFIAFARIKNASF